MARCGRERKVQCRFYLDSVWCSGRILLAKKVWPRLATVRYGCILIAPLLVCGSLAGASHCRGSALWNIVVEYRRGNFASRTGRGDRTDRRRSASARRAAGGERLCGDRPVAARGRVSSGHAGRVRGGLRRFRRGVAGLGGRAFGLGGRRGIGGNRSGANVLSAGRGGLGHRAGAVDRRAAGERPRRTLGARPSVAFARGSGGACLVGEQAGQGLSPLATGGRSGRRIGAVRPA
jgi:hypothetical protein